MAENTHGVEAIQACTADLTIIIPRLIARAKDGVGVDDVLALATDAAFRAAIESLIANAKKVGGEAKDLTLEEGAVILPGFAGLVVASVKAAKN